MVEPITLLNYEEFEGVTQRDLSLVAFGTPWSSPCQDQYRIFVSFCRKYSGTLVIARVDVEKHPKIAQKCNIQTVPTLILFRNGKEINRLFGLQSAETLNEIIQV